MRVAGFVLVMSVAAFEVSAHSANASDANTSLSNGIIDLAVRDGAISVGRCDHRGFAFEHALPEFTLDGVLCSAGGHPVSLRESRFRDRIGQGTELTLEFGGYPNGFSLAWRVRLYDCQP